MLDLDTPGTLAVDEYGASYRVYSVAMFDFGPLAAAV